MPGYEGYAVLVCDADQRLQRTAGEYPADAEGYVLALEVAALEAVKNRDAVILVRYPDGGGLRITAWG